MNFKSQTFLFLEHSSFSNIPLSRTSLYLEHPSFSNISLSQTSLYLKHPSFSNIPVSRTPLFLEHPCFSNIPLSRKSLHLEHPSISNIPLYRAFLQDGESEYTAYISVVNLYRNFEFFWKSFLFKNEWETYLQIFHRVPIVFHKDDCVRTRQIQTQTSNVCRQ